MNEHTLPPPGLQGTYKGSCIVCFQGTDTGLMLRGDAEWIIAGLMHLGMRDFDEAAAVVAHGHGCDPGMVPDGVLSPAIQVCESCVKKSGSDIKVGLVASGVLPCYQQPQGT